MAEHLIAADSCPTPGHQYAGAGFNVYSPTIFLFFYFFNQSESPSNIRLERPST